MHAKRILNLLQAWRSLNDLVALDDIKEESLDFGFDVTAWWHKF